METVFIFVHAMIWTGVLATLIYLVFRRIRLYKKENFEKRDN
ncbi:hypothetical protein SAMN04488508_103345 [Aquimarina spongiae]|uniref:Uncharacterized protein n=1 Tax=Aquimarina spongiae TaxID=570521 RepID=A0A1M6ECY4_9FLAO|nr:hypothetical protein SAMN04488508_103345 [Aquimarina spongiae]